ncbi:hypothetical protein TVAG_021270 [Trichomonas vaginalis G3]|uniref:Uncharacterized protein n=1 Tax=Trichomonas vaginalis (strain ATCC PRA-98 / G3) TaxID=412133 RepID=A2DHA9_TRIV3|nr:hypothetical protein TVAGG3_0677690 [Trichomonas vaginalis G3]EAY20182.1 hypothetical protein TVAG_021270 [Trichomonas vaginalis G3]KAI5507661.1 hypothetical protein TVAGG3_0677690 [Trichomonas vaginalis G3]|eukprot:XP_001581168.1 hypothetical protein [Trichomonas vaginalis G3]
MASHIFSDESPPPQRQTRAQDIPPNIKKPPPIIDQAEYEQVRKSYDPKQVNPDFSRFNSLVPPKTQIPKIDVLPPRLPMQTLQQFPDLKLENVHQIQSFDLGVIQFPVDKSFTPIKMPLHSLNSLKQIREDISIGNVEFLYKLKNETDAIPSQSSEANTPQQTPDRNTDNKQFQKMDTYSEFIDLNSSLFPP